MTTLKGCCWHNGLASEIETSLLQGRAVGCKKHICFDRMAPCYFSKCMPCFVEEGILKGSPCLEDLFLK